MTVLISLHHRLRRLSAQAMLSAEEALKAADAAHQSADFLATQAGEWGV